MMKHFNRGITYKILIIPVFCISIISCIKTQDGIPVKELDIYAQAWDVLLQRIDWTVQHIDTTHFPMLADNITGEWETYASPKWTGGFWVGMLWLAYEHTNNQKYLKYAQIWNDEILGYEQENNHDRGLVYYYSSVFGYRLVNNERYRQSAFKAAQKLVDMFQSESSVIPQNIKDKENVIIDTMMNLQLLWWAFSNANDTDPYKELYRQVAIDQSNTTLKDFIREDGSTWQSVHYDATSGVVIKKHTHQGFSDSSCWSRGQSWGLYGFTKAYEVTGNEDFLKTAVKIGEYIINNLPEDGVPWYDYNDSGKYKDSSAGAIAASGFLQLSKVVQNSLSKNRYENIGRQMIISLIQGYLTPFVGEDSPPGILQKGCYQIFRNASSETIWGDYYLMEALAQVIFPWKEE